MIAVRAYWLIGCGRGILQISEFSPRLVVVEFNPTVPNDVFFVQEDDPAVNQGASLLALIELAQSKGYELVATTEWNGFFVPRDLFPSFNIADNHIDAMHDPAHFESRLFQCYDGTLVLAGCKHLLLNSNNTLVASDDPEHLITTIGCDDLVVIHTPKATLVCKADQAEQIKQMHQQVGEKFGEELL